jgi:hypothetical protein
MHPILKSIESELNVCSEKQKYQFSLLCISEIFGNLEDADVIEAFHTFRRLMGDFETTSPGELRSLADSLRSFAQSHQGSKSIDGTRHAAVSATYALSKAVEGHAVEAAAYAAYSSIYGYGGYAVNDPDSFTEVHQRQLELLAKIKPERKKVSLEKSQTL